MRLRAMVPTLPVTGCDLLRWVHPLLARRADDVRLYCEPPKLWVGIAQDDVVRKSMYR
jgi:hypothetical protein